jgi:predicted dehydrogenase
VENPREIEDSLQLGARSFSAMAAEMRESLPGQEKLPRLGFLGVGWIGRNRMVSIIESGQAEVCAIADAEEKAACEAASLAPGASVAADLSELLKLDLDGIVIATPSANHAEQTLRVLDRGICVFCQKPLSRNARETQALVDKSRSANRALGVDLSYRGLEGSERIRRIIMEGEVGEIYAADLVFHNAYGPDKPWYYNLSQSGGGCVMDLGVHLVDLALWALGYPEVSSVTSRLFSGGRRWSPDHGTVEDFAGARIDLKNGGIVNLSCSWRVSAGCDALISATFYGTKGGLSLTNKEGSFYHFRAERFRSTSREVLSDGDPQWWGRTAVEWARRLRRDKCYDPDIERQVAVSRIIDSIYGRA